MYNAFKYFFGLSLRVEMYRKLCHESYQWAITNCTIEPCQLAIDSYNGYNGYNGYDGYDGYDGYHSYNGDNSDDSYWKMMINSL